MHWTNHGEFSPFGPAAFSGACSPISQENVDWRFAKAGSHQAWVVFSTITSVSLCQHWLVMQIFCRPKGEASWSSGGLQARSASARNTKGFRTRPPRDGPRLRKGGSPSQTMFARVPPRASRTSRQESNQRIAVPPHLPHRTESEMLTPQSSWGIPHLATGQLAC